MRYIHILCAGLAIGAPLFMRFVLMPAATSTLDDDTHQKLRAAIMKRWRMWVYMMITLFLVSGFYTYSVASEQWNVPKYYHMLFGMKFLAALFLFFVASGLAGRSRLFEFMRQNARQWLMVYIGVVIFVVVLAGAMRSIRDNVGKKGVTPREYSSAR